MPENFKCDGCGLEEATDQPGTLPSNWRRLSLSRRPVGFWDSDCDYLLCWDCYRAHCEWISTHRNKRGVSSFVGR